MLGCSSQPAGGKFPETLNQVRVRYEMTPARGGEELGVYLGRELLESIVSHDLPVEHLCNFQYRLG